MFPLHLKSLAFKDDCRWCGSAIHTHSHNDCYVLSYSIMLPVLWTWFTAPHNSLLPLDEFTPISLVPYVHSSSMLYCSFVDFNRLNHASIVFSLTAWPLLVSKVANHDILMCEEYFSTNQWVYCLSNPQNESPN